MGLRAVPTRAAPSRSDGCRPPPCHGGRQWPGGPVRVHCENATSVGHRQSLPAAQVAPPKSTAKLSSFAVCPSEAGIHSPFPGGRHREPALHSQVEGGRTEPGVGVSTSAWCWGRSLDPGGPSAAFRVLLMPALLRSSELQRSTKCPMPQAPCLGRQGGGEAGIALPAARRKQSPQAQPLPEPGAKRPGATAGI